MSKESRAGYTIEVDRIVLSGINLKQDRAERIKALVEIELKRLLEQEGLSEDLAEVEVSQLDMPGIYLAKPYDEEDLASRLARSIFQALLSIR
jgi:hypothetical protein